MEFTQGHEKYAEKCMAMALSSEQDVDKALWLSLAQSWARLGSKSRPLNANPALLRLTCEALWKLWIWSAHARIYSLSARARERRPLSAH